MTSVGLVLLLVLHLACCKDYHKVLEDALLANDENLENLRLSYFRTDHPKSIVVDISYTIRCDASAEDSTLYFRWMLSPINLYIEPELLQPLSLHTFHTHIPSVNLMLDLHQDCDDIPEINKTTCEDKVGIIGALDDLTANVSCSLKLR